MNKSLFVALAVASLAILPTSAQAVPITGDLNIAGHVTVDGANIDWLPQDGFGNELFVTDDIDVDYFTHLDGTFGDALDLNIFLQPPGPGGFPTLVGFMTFDADPGISFDLNNIALCEPATCFLPGTPFDAFQIGNNTIITMRMSGIVTDATGGDGPANWEGTWSATFTNQTIAQLLADFAEDGKITTSYDADIEVSIVPIPEPATMLTFGAGTALLAAARRRRAKKNASRN